MIKKRLAVVFLMLSIVLLMCLSGCGSDPARVKETGTYSAEAGALIDLESIDTSLGLIQVVVDEPDYASMTVDVEFYVAVNLPDPEKFEPYLDWLHDFSVNDVSASYELGMGTGRLAGGFMSLDSPSKIYRIDTLIYKVSYRANEKDQAFSIRCKASDQLDFSFTYDIPFWELDGIDPHAAAAYQEGKRVGKHIEAIYATELDRKTLQSESTYLVTGTVRSFGEDIFGNHYIVLDTADDYEYGYIVCAYGYFDQSEKMPYLSEGQEVSFYGVYQYQFLDDWYFEDCYF